MEEEEEVEWGIDLGEHEDTSSVGRLRCHEIVWTRPSLLLR